MTDHPPLNRYGKFTPGHFQLRRLLGQIVGLLYELRIEVFPDASFCPQLGYINSLLIDLIIDDEFGLIDATPEQRVAFAEYGS